MRLVPLSEHPEVALCTDCYLFQDRDVKADILTETDVEGIDEPIVGGLCANHAEVLDLSKLGQGPLSLPVRQN